MKKYNFILLLVIILSFLNVKAQKTEEDKHLINSYFQNITSEQVLAFAISSNNLVKNSNNFVDARMLNIKQSGNYNLINIKAAVSNQSINQVGNNNGYEFISFYSRDGFNFEVQQLGNDNFIQVLGENSLINNMKIIQKTNAKTITVINY